MNMSTTLYDTDFAEWATQTAELMRAGRLEDVDLQNVASEIEGLGRSEARTLGGQLKRVMVHLLKIRYQPHLHGRGWDLSIMSARNSVRQLLKESPSLRRKVPGLLLEEYDNARIKAAKQTGLPFETFPEECPFTECDVLGIEP
jgi:hypothetical protein